MGCPTEKAREEKQKAREELEEALDEAIKATGVTEEDV